MTHDIVIRGGTVVDGTGGPSRRADVAIDGDQITEVSDAVAARGSREIDADGLLVTPGFVDIHTHYDAQIGWDPLVTSSCFHGVTSVVMGNCGMTFAPCRADDQSYLAECMESVEDIPADTILDGLPWDWETYGEYLTTLDRLPKGLNVGGMVGHAALRWWAMGERSLEPGQTPASPEVEEMRRLIHEAMEGGALGLSTSRTLRHTVPDGRYVPGTWAETEELVALAGVLGRVQKGVIEVSPRFDGEGPSEARCRSELAWMKEVSITSGRPLTFNLTHTYDNPEHHHLARDLVRAANDDGAQIRPQTTARGIGALFTLWNMTPFDGHPSWQALKGLPFDEKLAVIRTPDRRGELIAEANLGPGRERLARWFVSEPDAGARYDCDPTTSLPARADAAGVPIGQFYVELLDRTDGRALVYWPLLNEDIDEIGQMLDDETMVLGLADGGAHVGQILDASQPTWFLTYWIRERRLMSLERAIRRLTLDGATLFGLDGRGTLAPGSYADVNVIDFDGLALPLPEYVNDFPLGAGRYVQRAAGYDTTIVNGQISWEQGEPTDAMAGVVLRP